MRYVDIFLDKEPEGVEVSDGEGGKIMTYPGFYNKKPVKVSNGDGTFHYHMLQTKEQYEARKALNDIEKPCDMFTECPRKYLNQIDIDEYRPKHVFGRTVHDLTLETVEEEPIIKAGK